MLRKTLQELDTDIGRIFSYSGKRHVESLRMFLSDSPSQYQDVFQHYDLTKFHFGFNRKYQDLVRLAILSWYFPEELRCLFQLCLEEHWSELDDFSVEKEILLVSKDVCLAWCILQENWNNNDFFGNIISEKAIDLALKQIKFLKKSRRRVKKYTGYCRGYRESNTGAPNDVPSEIRIGVEDEYVLLEKKLFCDIQIQTILKRISLFLSAS